MCFLGCLMVGKEASKQAPMDGVLGVLLGLSFKEGKKRGGSYFIRWAGQLG